MPSSPILQAWAKTVGPSPSKCSLKRRPRPALASILRSMALRPSNGSRRRSSPFSSIRVEGIKENAFVMVAVADAIERSDAVVNRLAVDDAGARAQAYERLHDQGKPIGEIIARA